MRLTASSKPVASHTQGDWASEQGSCYVVVRLEAVFSKKTMWKKRISQSVQDTGGRATTELMHLVRYPAQTDSSSNLSEWRIA